VRGQAIETSVRGPVGELWLDRPAARNAMGPEFFAERPENLIAFRQGQRRQVRHPPLTYTIQQSPQSLRNQLRQVCLE